MNVLNWAGLVINGSVAFILPLILCSYFYYNKSHHQPDLHDVELSHSRFPKHPEQDEDNNYNSIVTHEKVSIPQNNNSGAQIPVEKSLPNCMIPYRWWIVHSIIVLFVIMIIATIVLDILTGSGPWDSNILVAIVAIEVIDDVNVNVVEVAALSCTKLKISRL